MSASTDIATPRRPRSFRLWVVWTILAKAAGVALFLTGHRALAPFVFLSPSPWLIWQFLVPTSYGFGPAVRRFRTDRREVWLTIDDGPDPLTTPRVLDLLDAHRARATFFVIGQKAARHPSLIAEITRRGHTLGNHTHNHPLASYWIAGATRTGREIDACNAALHAAGASAQFRFRSPVGQKSFALHRELARRGLDLILWSARGYDTQVRDSAQAIRRIQKKITPGAIILLHESGASGSPRIEVIAGLLAHLDASGYTAVVPASDQLERC